MTLLLGTLPFIPPAEGAPADLPPDTPPDLPPDLPPDPPPSDPPSSGSPSSGSPSAGPAGPAGPITEDVPCPGDEDAPCDDYAPCHDGAPCDDDAPCDDAARGDCDPDEDGDDPDELCGSAPVWPDLPAGAVPARTPPAVVPPAGIPPAFARPGSADSAGRPAAGLLDLTLPWLVLAGLSLGPGWLGRIGPVTASQAARLGRAAAADPAAHWRVIVTTSDGQALAVTRVPRRIQARDGPVAGTGLVGRVTLTISEDVLTSPPDLGRRGSSARILGAALRAAKRALVLAWEQARADAAAGGCAHAGQSPAYRPPPRLQEHVVARDQTCRYLRCRQPAWRGDLDHTIPWPDGRTCRCNLGGVCRTHHMLKQHPGWTLRQLRPGIFEWTTPSGRTYLATPDTYPV